jgi:hypothetical protein
VANEIQFIDQATGRHDYVHITDAVGQWLNRNAEAFEPFNPVNFAEYDVPATEFGSSKLYEADMPAWVPAGVYNVTARNRAAGAPPAAAAQSDAVVAVGTIVWGGAAVVDSSRLLELFEADEVIRTDTVPWRLEYRRKGTATVLLSKNLKQLDGSNLVGEDVAVGQKVQ